MEELEEIQIDEWFEAIVDIGLDEYLHELFQSVEESNESNVNNFSEYEYQ